jgi:hypothetical protein
VIRRCKLVRERLHHRLRNIVTTAIIITTTIIATLNLMPVVASMSILSAEVRDEFGNALRGGFVVKCHERWLRPYGDEEPSSPKNLPMRDSGTGCPREFPFFKYQAGGL